MGKKQSQQQNSTNFSLQINEQKEKLHFKERTTKQIIFPKRNPYHKSSVQLSSCLLCISPGKIKKDKQWYDPNY